MPPDTENPVQHAVGELIDLRRFVRLAWQGLEMGLQVTEVAERLKSSIIPETRDHYNRKDVLDQIHDEHSFAKRQEADRFQYLYALACVRVWSILEVFVKAVVTDRLQTSSIGALNPKLLELKGPLVEFAGATKEQRAAILYELITQTSNARLKPGVGRFEALLEMVALSGPVHDVIRRKLLELSVVRNVVVHRSSTIDTRALIACPWVGGASGEHLKLSHERYESFDMAASWYIREVSRRTCYRDGQLIAGFDDYVTTMVSGQAGLELALSKDVENVDEQQAPPVWGV